jgi:hypothetical protein
VIWLGGLLPTILGFIFGRVFSQSEAILADKHRVYEEFLRVCYVPNDAYEEIAEERIAAFKAIQGPFLLYAAQHTTLALNHYLIKFDKAQQVLPHEERPLHPVYVELAKAHNDLILEMRRDGVAFSAFAYTGKSRLPADALEQAKRAVS